MNYVTARLDRVAVDRVRQVRRHRADDQGHAVDRLGGARHADRVAELLSSGSNFRSPPANFFRANASKDARTIGETTALVFMGDNGYFHGEHRDRLHETRSAAKSLTATLVGAAMQDGLPVRLDWAAKYHGRALVVYGHTPVAEPRWRNNTVDVDTGCVFGAKNTVTSNYLAAAESRLSEWRAQSPDDVRLQVGREPVKRLTERHVERPGKDCHPKLPAVLRIELREPARGVALSRLYGDGVHLQRAADAMRRYLDERVRA